MLGCPESFLLELTFAGAPGVGKTSTAECIARLILKPLYPITFGALGTTYEEIESRLTFHLALASKWNCVVLLDEADLFLSRRNRSEFKRNSIVVTFLRALDYYSGVIVMTTNRVGTLDEAVQSRVHISLYCRLILRTLCVGTATLIIFFRPGIYTKNCFACVQETD